MPKQKLIVEMSGDEAKLWASFQKIQAAEQGVEQGLGKIGAASDEVKRRQRELGRIAKQAYDSTRTPQEQYKQRLSDLRQHMGNLKTRMVEVTAQTHKSEKARAKHAATLAILQG